MMKRHAMSDVLASRRGRASLLALIGLVTAVTLESAHAAGGAPRDIAAQGSRGMSSQTVACQRAGVMVCNPAAAAARNFPLSEPDPRRISGKAGTTGTGLLTEAQVLAQLGWSTAPSGSINASLMTYGQAQTVAPGLAAESATAVDPSREVWVVTRYYSTPVTVAGLDTPPGAPDTMQLSSASVVIDAESGTPIDSCGNCDAVTATP